MASTCHSWISVSVFMAFLLPAGLMLEFTKCVLAKLLWSWCCCPGGLISIPPDTAKQPGSEVGALWKGVQPPHLVFLSDYSCKGIFCLSLLMEEDFSSWWYSCTSRVTSNALLLLWFSLMLQFMHIKNRIQEQQDTVPTIPHIWSNIVIACVAFLAAPSVSITSCHLP